MSSFQNYQPKHARPATWDLPTRMSQNVRKKLSVIFVMSALLIPQSAFALGFTPDEIRPNELSDVPVTSTQDSMTSDIDATSLVTTTLPVTPLPIDPNTCRIPAIVVNSSPRLPRVFGSDARALALNQASAITRPNDPSVRRTTRSLRNKALSYLSIANPSVVTNPPTTVQPDQDGTTSTTSAVPTTVVDSTTSTPTTSSDMSKVPTDQFSRIDAASAEFTSVNYSTADESPTTTVFEVAPTSTPPRQTASPYSNVAPSGDVHDYFSYDRYYWLVDESNPELGWEYRDGQTNPNTLIISDQDQLETMSEASFTLAMDFWINGNFDSADKAVQIIRTFFLDDATRMNPNSLYASYVPGLDPTARGFGILQTREITKVIDAIGLLEGDQNTKAAPTWTSADHDGMLEWFGDYLGWLTQSTSGKRASVAKNNHRTWYNAQVAAIAAYVGNYELATKLVCDIPAIMSSQMIDGLGNQPLEMGRTRSNFYQTFNLLGFLKLANVGRQLGLNAFGFVDQNGASIAGITMHVQNTILSLALNATEEQTQDIRGTKLTILRLAANLAEDNYWFDSAVLTAIRSDSDLNVTRDAAEGLSLRQIP